MALGPAGTVEVRVEGDFSSFESQLERSGKRAGAGYGAALGKAALGAGVIAAGKGILDFSSFESSMNEVFTLLPDISDAAMSEMSGQVKDFAKDFGVLPNDVIPSLYDSLSAGVPQDNVFAFLEDANKFAKAGAVDLSTAVDGLTSTLNAYGRPAEDAAAVSDALFTAVKLGKTTVGELSDSMFQVAPIAASFGVTIEEIAAGFATLTAQGTPTSVAATQLKGAISELGKEGTKASDAFKEITGESFAEFIANGGDLQEAAVQMSDGADHLGVSIVDLFGSIEAGQAFVGLASDTQAAAQTLRDVQDGAGATQAAFDRMETGLKPVLDRLKARFAVSLIELGEALAPIVEDVGLALAGLIDFFTSLPAPMQKGIVLFGALTAGALAFAGPIGKLITIGKSLLSVFSLMAAHPVVLGLLALVAVGFLIVKNWDTVKAALTDAWNAIKSAAETTWNAIKNFFAQYWPLILGIFTGGIGLVVGLIIQNWDAIWSKTKEIWNGIAGFFGEVGSRIFEKIDTFIISPVKAVIGFFESLPEIATTAWNGLKSAIEGVAEWIKTKLGEIGEAADKALGPIDEIIGAGAKLGGGIIGGIGGVLGFDTGGVVPGRIGAPRLAVVHGGETILPTHRTEALGPIGGTTITIPIEMNVSSEVSDPAFWDQQATKIGRTVRRELERDQRGAGIPVERGNAA